MFGDKSCQGIDNSQRRTYHGLARDHERNVHGGRIGFKGSGGHWEVRIPVLPARIHHPRSTRINSQSAEWANLPRCHCFL